MLGSEQPAAHFPVSAKVPESTRHLRLRTLVYQFLEYAFADVAMVGSEQFMYWDPTNPRACLSPDAFVRFGSKNEDFQSWKVWERGAPHVAVEIISDSDASELKWEEKLERYRRLGISELVWFDQDSPERPLRIWDFVGDDLLERRLLETLGPKPSSGRLLAASRGSEWRFDTALEPRPTRLAALSDPRGTRPAAARGRSRSSPRRRGGSPRRPNSASRSSKQSSGAGPNSRDFGSTYGRERTESLAFGVRISEHGAGRRVELEDEATHVAIVVGTRRNHRVSVRVENDA